MNNSFPVLSVLDQLRQALNDKGLVLLLAAPGAGKSTVLPLHLLPEHRPWQGKIVMMQPRRVAARAVAQRLAEQLGEEPGGTVGYRMRLETCVSVRTQIEVVTEGVLARMIQADPTLDGVGLLIFDEFHERSLHADTALAVALQVRQLLRPDVRVLIMSATLPAASLLEPLGYPPVIETPARTFPVHIVYDSQPATEPVWQKVAAATVAALREHEGDLLAFLPGAREIKRTQELLERAGLPIVIHPLYGELPLEQQHVALLPDRHGRRKVVLATNIAETSLTIEGVRVVVDSGLVRNAVFDARTGLPSLQTQRITLDAAEQRAGRAGRTAPGVCYRLWTMATHHQLKPVRKPEIEEADLSAVVLLALRWGVKDVYELPWITPPPVGAVAQALQLLNILGAVDDNGLTDRGKKMSEIPAHPRLAHLLTIRFDSLQQAALAADVAALLDERDILRNHPHTDFVLRVEALRRYRKDSPALTVPAEIQRVLRLAAQWRKWLNVAEDNEAVSARQVGYLLLQAYPDRLAAQIGVQSARYRLRSGRVVYLDNHDPLTNNKWIVAAHADAGVAEGRIYLAAAVAEDDLKDLATLQTVIRWDEQRGMITVLNEYRIGSLVLKTEPARQPAVSQTAAVLFEVIRQKGLSWIGWTEEHQQWCNRVLSLRTWRPDEAWPEVHPDRLLNRLNEWLAPFIRGIYRKEDFRNLPLKEALTALIPFDLQHKLDQLAPERLKVPSGSWIKIFYKPDGQLPHVEVRLQECFGLMQTPTVNHGKTPVVLHLLSPGFKPVQITQDLPGFWRSTYPAVRRELMRRYPKHAWPEDPLTALPVKGAARHKKNALPGKT